MTEPVISGTAALTNDERYARGLAVLRRIGGPDYDVQLKAAARTAPDLARLTVEFAYGDIIGRDGLALTLRQVVTVAIYIITLAVVLFVCVKKG